MKLNRFIPTLITCFILLFSSLTTVHAETVNYSDVDFKDYHFGREINNKVDTFWIQNYFNDSSLGDHSFSRVRKVTSYPFSFTRAASYEKAKIQDYIKKNTRVKDKSVIQVISQTKDKVIIEAYYIRFGDTVFRNTLIYNLITISSNGKKSKGESTQLDVELTDQEYYNNNLSVKLEIARNLSKKYNTTFPNEIPYLNRTISVKGIENNFDYFTINNDYNWFPKFTFEKKVGEKTITVGAFNLSGEWEQEPLSSKNAKDYRKGDIFKSVKKSSYKGYTLWEGYASENLKDLGYLKILRMYSSNKKYYVDLAFYIAPKYGEKWSISNSQIGSQANNVKLLMNESIDIVKKSWFMKIK